jgi:dsDNA-specific endonuclease/ATPase MutS2
MDTKTLTVLDYPKILARLAEFCDFSASAELALALQPTPEFEDTGQKAKIKGVSSARGGCLFFIML